MGYKANQRSDGSGGWGKNTRSAEGGGTRDRVHVKIQFKMEMSSCELGDGLILNSSGGPPLDAIGGLGNR